MLLLLTLIFSVTTALAPPTSQIPTLSNRLLGKFSNVKQVTSELSSSPPLTPGISGGHELLFSTISRVDCLPYNYNDDPHSEIGILATYRFGHSKGTIFRTRLYTFTDLPGSKIAMRVCKLLEPPSDSPDPNMMYTEGIDFDAIPNCDVIWSSVPGQFDPDLFTYLPSLPSLVSTSAFHGTLGKSGSEVISDRTKKLMTVFDELSLTESVLYLNDRAFSKQTGEQLYGNFKNMPYILDKISASCCKDFNWLTGKATSNKIIQEKLRKLNCNSNGTPIIVSN
ncbi:hypothetical protein ScalyP_jg3742 [Parmales sp. scaly parma]|nr:hypothetical protein ScalyP_jg3742 [Parmales sp. scaly parma]